MKLEKKLYSWYLKNKRDLPWRKDKDPYKIWISETMLQQTTTTAVIPYFHNFIKKFPTLKNLAHAPLEEVLEAWAGLGYYSRARNLHKAANALLNNGGFKENNSFEKLILYPGFGPYTSRSVSSLAFLEKVGVLDGNVIRVLCRVFNFNFQWWKSSEKNKLQELSDQWAQYKDSSVMNQAIMELGATICTPKSPSCLLCPLNSNCISRKLQNQETLPIKKPKRSFENYLWKPQVVSKKIKGKVHIALIKNNYTPFLKNQWIFPGTIEKKIERPKAFEFKHTITHHQIFVQPELKSRSKKLLLNRKNFDPLDVTWAPLEDIKKWNPTSLVSKIIGKI